MLICCLTTNGNHTFYYLLNVRCTPINLQPNEHCEEQPLNQQQYTKTKHVELNPQIFNFIEANINIKQKEIKRKEFYAFRT